MSTEAMKRALEAAYLAGFGATGEGYNAEYPFEGKDPEQDDNWLVKRDEYVRQAIADAALDQMADNARELGLSYEQPAPAQPPIHAELHCVCGCEWEWRNRTWELVSNPPAPASKPWVGLTDEEVNNYVQAVWPRNATPVAYTRTIEAKLKEKNT